MKTRGSSSKAEPPRDASYPMNAGPRRRRSDALALSHAFRELRTPYWRTSAAAGASS